MTWVQAALESRAEGTASSVAHTWGGSAVSWQKSCEDQDCLWPGVVVVEPLGLCGHLSCLLGKLEYPWGLSSILASGQYLTALSCHLLPWGWSWAPRPRRESQDSWGGLLIDMQLILSWMCTETEDKP